MECDKAVLFWKQICQNNLDQTCQTKAVRALCKAICAGWSTSSFKKAFPRTLISLSAGVNKNKRNFKWWSPILWPVNFKVRFYLSIIVHTLSVMACHSNCHNSLIMHQLFETPAPPPIRALAGDCGDFHLIYTSFWSPSRGRIRLKSRSSHPLPGYLLARSKINLFISWLPTVFLEPVCYAWQ